jgi:tellurite methyltransferase
MAAIIPSTFIADWVVRIARERPRGDALDLASGRGRHTGAMSAAGLRTFAVDRKLDALRDAVREAMNADQPILAWCADLTQHPLPRDRFDLIVVARYLQRDLFPSLRESVKRGGFVVYETFTRDQLAHGTGPKLPDHLLDRGELRACFDDWDVVFYEEVVEREAVARLVARRP